ncbi:MAG: enhanced intracellular survival protein Eis [Fimbriimonadaceae bacterium]
MEDSIELKWASPDEYQQTLRIWQKVYGPDIFPEERITPLEFQRFVIGTVNGVPAFASIVCDYPTLWRGEVVRGAGVAAVGTLPEFRGGGVGQQMMDRLVGLMAEANYEVASLYGFREPFYRKSGFEGCGWRWRITCPAHQLPKVGGELEVREIDADHVAEIMGCYRQFAARFNGSCDRTAEHWNRRLGKKAPQIYAVGNPVEGYLWANPFGFWNDLEIGEIAWTSDRGYRSLLNLMRTLAINKTNVVWCEPPESAFGRRYVDGAVEMAKSRPTMFAVIDPESLLNRLGVEFDQFSFEFMGQTIGSGPKVEIDRLQLAQVLMGSPSLDELVNWGEVTGDLGAIEYLQKFVRPMSVCCMEFF